MHRNRLYFAALDLGVRNDHSALVILAINPVRRIIELANCISWRPDDYGGTVDLQEVESTVLAAHQLYGLACLAFDPWQAHLMAQRLASQGVPVRECPFTPENRNHMARAMLKVFVDRRIALYHDPDLARDLLRIRIKETAIGFKLDAVRDADGHADRAIALAMILPSALYEVDNYRPDECEPCDEVLVA